MLCAADDEHLVGRTGAEVGADLCGALVALLPDDALAPAPAPGHPPITSAGAQTPMPGTAAPSPAPPSAARSNPLAASTSSLLPTFAAQHGPAGRHAGHADGGTAASAAVQSLSSSDLCIIIALRNLLAFSSAAKTAALRNGYHRFLFDSCRRAAALLAPATPSAKLTGGERKQPGGQPGGTPKKQAAGLQARGVRGSVVPSVRVSAGGQQRYRGLRPPAPGSAAPAHDPVDDTEIAGSEVEGLIDEPQVLLASPQIGRPSEVAAASARGGGQEHGFVGPAAPAAAAQARRMLEQKVRICEPLQGMRNTYGA